MTAELLNWMFNVPAGVPAIDSKTSAFQGSTWVTTLVVVLIMIFVIILNVVRSLQTGFAQMEQQVSQCPTVRQTQSLIQNSLVEHELITPRKGAEPREPMPSNPYAANAAYGYPAGAPGGPAYGGAYDPYLAQQQQQHQQQQQYYDEQQYWYYQQQQQEYEHQQYLAWQQSQHSQQHTPYGDGGAPMSDQQHASGQDFSAAAASAAPPVDG